MIPVFHYFLSFLRAVSLGSSIFCDRWIMFLQDPNVNNIVAATTFFSQAGATLCLVLYLALATYVDIPALISAS